MENYQRQASGNKIFDSNDIHENVILNKIPDILNILLIDRTTSTPKKYGEIYRLSTPTGYYTANKDKVKFIFAVKAGGK